MFYLRHSDKKALRNLYIHAYTLARGLTAQYFIVTRIVLYMAV